VRLVLPAQLVRPAPRAHKASKDPSVPRVPSGSGGRLALRERPDQSDRRVRRGKLVARAQSAPPANADRQDRPDQSDPRVRRGKPVAKAQPDPLVNADRQDRRALLACPARPDRRARRVTRAQHRQFASSPVQKAFAAETTKSWLVLFARAVRPTERSARRLARQQPAYVYVGNIKPHLGALACSLRQRSRFRKSGLYLLPSPAFREVSHRGLARRCVTM
jgi:hypothetical protein